LILTIVVYVADLAAARTAWAGIITPESGGSSNADRIEGLYRIVLIIAAVIFPAVAGALVYFLVKYRARRGHVASQVRGNTRLEIAWTGAAALILVVLAVLTFSRLHGIVTPAASAGDAAGAVFTAGQDAVGLKPYGSLAQVLEAQPSRAGATECDGRLSNAVLGAYVAAHEFLLL
jgi:cytochrome c oxidase subunit II